MDAELGGEGEGECMNDGGHAAITGIGVRMSGCAERRSSDA